MGIYNAQTKKNHQNRSIFIGIIKKLFTTTSNLHSLEQSEYIFQDAR